MQKLRDFIREEKSYNAKLKLRKGELEGKLLQKFGYREHNCRREQHQSKDCGRRTSKYEQCRDRGQAYYIRKDISGESYG